MLVGLHCKCGKRLKVPESRIGKSGTCPNCRAGLRLVAPGYRTGVDQFDGFLEITNGPDRIGEVIFLAGPGPIEIGRHPDKHIVLAGQTISRTHCRLTRAAGFSPAGPSDTDDAWRVEDNKSTSGLYVNGRRIDAAQLHTGDKLRIGDYELRYTSYAAAENPQSAFDALPVFTEPAFTTPGLDENTANDESTPADDAADPSPLAASLDDDSLYKLSDGDALEVPREHEPTSVTALAAQPTGGPTCPSCKKSLAPNAKICIACGIDLKTGRAIITSHATDLDTVYERTHSIIWWLSWLIWTGVYPVASEAFGVRKPYFIRAIAALTILTSIWFWRYDWTDSPQMASAKNYMLWVGKGKPDPAITMLRYEYTSYGDREAFTGNLKQLQREAERRKPKSDPKTGKAKAKPAVMAPTAEKPSAAEDKTDTDSQSDEDDEEELLDEEDEADSDLILAAHEALPPEKQCYGHYSPGQLITHAFLHADLLHLAGNLLFLLVIGSRINALVGNLPMIIIYPVLAVAAAIVYMASEQSSAPQAMLGASGAIMGLSGMYLVLMPVHKVHVAAWLRWGLIRGFHLSFKLFPVRGFWVVLFYIAFDIIYTALGVDDGVAHWAHLGGFFAGIGIALILLFTRLVNCRGGDIVSAMLGKQAWAFIGKPDLNRKAPLEYGW